MIDPSAAVAGAVPEPADGRSALAQFATVFSSVTDQVCTVVKGKREQVRLALVCLFARGHVLVEDVPGVGKTSLAKAIAHSLGLSWARVQFTPDLLPADITGTTVLGPGGEGLAFRRGPIFTNFLLADEVNRASPKTQSALLEAMQERQVTVGDQTHSLPSPFLVMATQNPAGHEGTFALPVSELDRFLVRARLGYPDRASTVEMLRQADGAPERLAAVVDATVVLRMISTADQVFVAPVLQEYMADLAQATRSHRSVELGLSPRALVGLQAASRSLAAAEGRAYVVPDDIKRLLGPVAAHRLVLTPEAVYAGTEAGDVLDEVVVRVPPPVPPSRREPYG